MVGQKDAMIQWKVCNDWPYRSCFTPLRIAFGCHWVSHFTCICMQSRMLMPQIRETLQYKYEVWLICLFGNNLQGITCIPHRFLYSIFENYSTNFKPLFLAESSYFHLFLVLYLIVVDFGTSIVDKLSSDIKLEQISHKLIGVRGKHSYPIWSPILCVSLVPPLIVIKQIPSCTNCFNFVEFRSTVTKESSCWMQIESVGVLVINLNTLK
jgi:hypothetical protein